MRKINVIAFGGLGGAVFSAGLKTILMRLQRIDGVDYCTYEDYASWRRWAQTLRGWRDPTVLIGHSFGVTAALAVTRSLRDAGRGPRLPLMVAFDPSQWWWSNPALIASGGNGVPATLECVINFYQASGPIGRQKLYRESGSQAGIDNRLITGAMHGAIEDRRDLQDATVNAVRLVIDTLKQAA
jgi:hypothetical protein